MHNPQPSPRKPSFWRRKIGLLPVWSWILIAIIMGIIGSFISGRSSSSSTTATTNSTPTPATHPTTQPTHAPNKAPTQAPKWVVIKKFSGQLSRGDWYYSPYFTVPNNWRVSWQSPDRDQSMPLVTIVGYDHSGKHIAGDDEVAAHSSSSDISGVGQVQKHGGTIQLLVFAQGDWSIEVSALKSA